MNEKEFKRALFDSYVQGRMDTLETITEFLLSLRKSSFEESESIFKKAFPEVE